MNINEQSYRVDVVLYDGETSEEGHFEIFVGWARDDDESLIFELVCPSDTRRIDPIDPDFQAVVIADVGAECRISFRSEPDGKARVYTGKLSSPMVWEVPNIARYAPDRREQHLRLLKSWPTPRFVSRLTVAGEFRSVNAALGRDLRVSLRSFAGGFTGLLPWNVTSYPHGCDSEEGVAADRGKTEALWDRYADEAESVAWLLDYHSQDPLHSYGCVFEVAVDGGRILHLHDGAYHRSKERKWTVHVPEEALTNQKPVSARMRLRYSQEPDLPKCATVRIAVERDGAFLRLRHLSCEENCTIDRVQEAAFEKTRCGLPLGVQTRGFGRTRN